MSLSVLSERYREVRLRTATLAAPLSDADATVQSMPDASPAKWHLAHTTWFFETFVLGDHVPGYRVFDEGYGYLFNSYYDAEGARLTRSCRGMLTRPDLEAIFTYRAYVDAALEASLPDLSPKAMALVELGIQHEQQHQELLLTDILHLFGQNPLRPVYARETPAPAAAPVSVLQSNRWIEHPGGIVSIGHSGAGFAYDCESPRHEVLLQPFSLADRLVTNGEWLAFLNDGGYRDPSLWLSDGWAWVQSEQIAGSSLLASTGRCLVNFHTERPRACQPKRASDPCQLL